MAFDVARLGRIAAAFVAKGKAEVVRGEKVIDVRPLVVAVDVVEDARIAAALEWEDGPMLRVRVKATADGSAKPSEVARALGVAGSDDGLGPRALVARLAVVAGGVRVGDVGVDRDVSVPA
jgi:hypothetical protein